MKGNSIPTLEFRPENQVIEALMIFSEKLDNYWLDDKKERLVTFENKLTSLKNL